jgi:hypothetical protein
MPGPFVPARRSRFEPVIEIAGGHEGFTPARGEWARRLKPDALVARLASPAVDRLSESDA